MNVNGIQNAYSSYATDSYKKTESKTSDSKVSEAKTSKSKTSEAKSSSSTESKGVVYNASGKMSDADRAQLVKKLKAETESRMQNMQSLVENLFKQQGLKIKGADDMWKKLASGDFTVDKETAEKAKQEISEDGYWGVNQTSDRIFEMAKALSGGDSEKMDKMLDAFKKGFKQATKAWGSSLPDISNQTYDAVLKKFEDYKNGIEQ